MGVTDYIFTPNFNTWLQNTEKRFKVLNIFVPRLV